MDPKSSIEDTTALGERTQELIPGKKAALKLPIRHHPTRLDDITEDVEENSSDDTSSCGSWEAISDSDEEKKVEAQVRDANSVEEIPAEPEVSYLKLYQAIIFGDQRETKYQLDLGAYIDDETDDGFSPLVMAILEEQVDIVRLLLERGADANHRVKRMPPLVHAVMRSDHGCEMMQLVLDHGAVLNTISGPEQRTALHWAAAEGMAEAVDFLIEKGMDMEAKCSKGRTPLILAAEFGHTDAANILWVHGADLRTRSDNGGTALTWAACNNRVEVVEFLLKQGAEVDLRDTKGHTALSLASHFGYVDVVNLLLDHDADIDTRSDEPKDCTPVMAAACSNSVAVLRTLISHGCDLSLTSGHGDNVLDVALLERQTDAVRVLLDAMGGENYPKESVALQIALANGHTMIRSLMATASLMYSYMEYVDHKLEPNKFAWLDWVLNQGGHLVKQMAMSRMLHAALEDRDIDLVETLGRHGCDMNRRLESGHTPLSFSVGHRHLELIHALLDAGADPNRRLPEPNEMNYTAFDTAIIHLKTGLDTEVVDLLLKSGRCHINQGRDPASTAFSYVLGKAKVWAPGVAESLAIRMIDSIPDVNADRDDIGCTLLHAALHHEREDFIDILLGKGADIEATAASGYTPFILSSQRSPSMIPILIERGADVHARYKANAGALHAAAADGNIESLQFLINWGLDIEDQTANGFTPLACALTWGMEEAALCLLSQGASAHFQTRGNLTALHFAARNGLDDVVEEILKQNVDIDAKDEKGWTALHEACATGTPNTVSLLLAASASINSPLPNRDTPLHVSLINENEDIALLLIEHGADTAARASKNRTALHLAADYGLPRVARVLQDSGVCSAADTDIETWTPLCCCSHPEIVEQLIEGGADVHYADQDGWTPLHQAVNSGDVEVAKLLVAAGAKLGCRTTDDGLTVMERAMDLEDWGGQRRIVSPRLLRSAVARRRCQARREREREAREKEEREKDLGELGGMFEEIESEML